MGLPVPGGPYTNDRVDVGDCKKDFAARSCMGFDVGKRRIESLSGA